MPASSSRMRIPSALRRCADKKWKSSLPSSERLCMTAPSLPAWAVRSSIYNTSTSVPHYARRAVLCEPNGTALGISGQRQQQLELTASGCGGAAAAQHAPPTHPPGEAAANEEAQPQARGVALLRARRPGREAEGM